MHRISSCLAAAALTLGCKNETASEKDAPEASPPTPVHEADPPARMELPLLLVGAIDVPGGPALEYFARIEQAEGKVGGTLSIPKQGAMNVELSNLVLEGATPSSR